MPFKIRFTITLYYFSSKDITLNYFSNKDRKEMQRQDRSMVGNLFLVVVQKQT